MLLDYIPRLSKEKMCIDKCQRRWQTKADHLSENFSIFISVLRDRYTQRPANISLHTALLNTYLRFSSVQIYEPSVH